MSDKIYLGPIDYHYAEVMRECRNDPRINKWCRQVGFISQRDQELWLERQNSDPTVDMLTILDSKKNFLGVCGLTSIQPIFRHAEFSMYIHPKQQGNGYGRRALKMLLEYAFGQRALNRVWGEVFESNPALKMFFKLGFGVEGFRKEFYFKDGHYIDATLISIGVKQFGHKLSAVESTDKASDICTPSSS